MPGLGLGVQMTGLPQCHTLPLYYQPSADHLYQNTLFRPVVASLQPSSAHPMHFYYLQIITLHKTAPHMPPIPPTPAPQLAQPRNRPRKSSSSQRVTPTCLNQVGPSDLRYSLVHFSRTWIEPRFPLEANVKWLRHLHTRPIETLFWTPLILE